MQELSMEEMCANEGQPCYCQTVKKCKTYKEDKILVNLRIVHRHVSFTDSKSKVKKKLLWGNTVNVKNKIGSIFEAIVMYSIY